MCFMQGILEISNVFFEETSYVFLAGKFKKFTLKLERIFIG